jgi:ABC-type transport system involved in cytochrome bd biosynthesis fused ATPase/permease subunit
VLLLAKERIILLLVSSAYIGIKLAIAVLFIHRWSLVLGFLLAAGTVFASVKIMAGRRWSISYAALPGAARILDLRVVGAGFSLSLAFIAWLRPH